MQNSENALLYEDIDVEQENDRNHERRIEGRWVFGPKEGSDFLTFGEWAYGSPIHSDEWSAHSNLDSMGYEHSTVNHQQNYMDLVTETYTQCTSLPGGRGYSVYRVFFAVLFLLLLVLDLLWLTVWKGVDPQYRISACLDASEFAIFFTTLAYFLLAHSAYYWARNSWDQNSESNMPYRTAWLFYTCGVNAVFTTMTIFWIFYDDRSYTCLIPFVHPINWQSALEQMVKHTIPGLLIMIDLSISCVPLYFCNALYPMLVNLVYLGVSTLGLYLSYILGSGEDPKHAGPSEPTVWIGSNALLPNGYRDFNNVPRILQVLFGAFALPLVVHTLLLIFVILRDFLAKQFCTSTDGEIAPGLGDTDLVNIDIDPTHQSSTSSFTTDNRPPVSPEKAPTKAPTSNGS